MKQVLINWTVIFLILFLNGSVCTSQNGHHLPQVLVITGGHDFEEPAFFACIFSHAGMQMDTLRQPIANRKIAEGLAMNYDVVVLYDMIQNITEEEKISYLNYLKAGKGLVVLHHALVSYQTWEEFFRITGGRYIENAALKDIPPSGYKHDIEIAVYVEAPDHPVCKGLHDFSLMDEGYSSLQFTNDIQPVLSTGNPDCSRWLAWVKNYGPARIVAIQLGHGESAYNNENFRKLLFNSIRWVAGD